MASKNTDQPASGGEAAPKGQVVTPDQKKTLLQRAEAGEKLPVGELAAITGNVVRRVNLPRITTVNNTTGATEVDHAASVFSTAHAVAATLHGWSGPQGHSHHSGAPMQLTLRDYQAALKAAEGPPEGYLTPIPHEAAFSPFAPPITLVTTKLERQPFPEKKASQ
jgi:hypothetical protein